MPKKLTDVKLPKGSSVTSSLHGRPKAPSKQHATVIAAVRNWQQRNLSVQDDDTLQKLQATLAAKEPELASISPQAPRLLLNVTSELNRRSL